MQDLIYTTYTPVADNLAETSVWRANVQNLSQPTLIATVPHIQGISGVTNPALSPDGKYLVYVVGERFREHLAMQLLNLADGTIKTIDQGRIIPGDNSRSFIWTSDSQTIIYDKEIDETVTEELYQYNLITEQIDLLMTEKDGLIYLIGINQSLIYYLQFKFSKSGSEIKRFNLETTKLETMFTVKADGVIKMSPTKTHALFNYTVVDLQTGFQMNLPISPALWLPDGQGVLGGYDLQAVYMNELNTLTDKPITITLKLPQTVTWEDLQAWSPDGNYMVYKSDIVNGEQPNILLNVQTGETQPFPPTRIFQVVGWLTAE